MSNTIAELAKHLIELDTRIKEHKQRAKEYQDARDVVEGEMIEQMALDGVQSLVVDGFTVFTHTSLRASIGKEPEALDALDLEGGGDLIKKTVNANSFTAWLKELRRDDWDGDERLERRFSISQELARFVRVYDQVQIRTRKK